MAVPPPTDDEFASVPDDASFDESFWRRYAVDVAGYRAEWVDQLLEDQGVAALVGELGTDADS
ncbi:hypothetical protein [Halolamina sp.]|jgi:hypothetical protein|uniref:hypothetical protein n=1 Tax=Halolamina sp. TaxID=1940283 RepID=UPI000223BDCB|nr:hypothetical protein Halar_2597 [halophilic archaeon DL31]